MGEPVAVITCSNRSAAGQREDTSGASLAEGLTNFGFDVRWRTIVPDDITAIRTAVTTAVEAGARAVITTGGTGITPTDVTPEAVAPLLDRQLPGVAEAIRGDSRDAVPTAVLSRGVAGTVGTAVVVTLPGSNGAVRDGLRVLGPILAHALDQLAGGDHRLSGGAGSLGGDPGGAGDRRTIVAAAGERWQYVDDRPISQRGALDRHDAVDEQARRRHDRDQSRTVL